MIDPCLEISQYQTRILQQRQDSWITVPMTLGGDLSLCGPDGPCPWKISGPTRVGEVLDVERAFLGPGTKAQILEDSRVLPTFAMLHPLPAGPCYILQVRAKKARCLSPTPDEPTVAVKRRLFHDDPDHCHATSCGDSSVLVASSFPTPSLPQELLSYFRNPPVSPTGGFALIQLCGAAFAKQPGISPTFQLWCYRPLLRRRCLITQTSARDQARAITLQRPFQRATVSWFPLLPQAIGHCLPFGSLPRQPR